MGWDIWFIPTDDAGGFVVGSVKPVRVDGCGLGLRRLPYDGGRFVRVMSPLLFIITPISSSGIHKARKSIINRKWHGFKPYVKNTPFVCDFTIWALK